MTNGTFTKMILRAAKTLAGKDLLYEAMNQMGRFPLSSEKLLYESDRSKVSEDAWKILLEAAERTDKQKLESMNRMLVESGCKPYETFGRAKV